MMLALSLEQLIDRFEDAWERGERPDIDAHLPPPGDEWLPALVELVHIELERRLKTGEDVRVEVYLGRYPQLGEPSLLVELVAAEFRHRRGGDSSETAAEYTRRFPQLADAIAGFTRAPTSDPSATVLPATLSLAAASNGAGGSHTGPVVTTSNYRHLRSYARGGLGEIYVAHDDALNREVALKFLHGTRTRNREMQARFLREAEITGRLEHPGVVPVYGLGHDSTGNPVYAMRFIRGQTLHEAAERFHSAKGRMTAGDRRVAFRNLLGRFISVCNTVAFAHTRGVIHRDLKPGNILLGEFGETLVVDWGLAKATGSGLSVEGNGSLPAPLTTDGPLPADVSSSDDPRPMDLPTADGELIGTPAFMAPEQAAGRLDEVGPASDLYSLGAILYVLLTGRPPFAAGSVAQTLAKVRAGDFDPPRQIDRHLPRALEVVCLKALATDPTRRYRDALELAGDLEHWLAGQPVGAWREPLALKARRWLGRHPTLVTGVATALVAATVLAGVTAVLRADKKLAEVRGDQASKELARADRDAYLHQVAQAGRAWLKGQREPALRYLDACKPELREWEWYHLRRCLGANSAVLSKHTKEVWAVAYSRDGKRLATAGLDGAVHVWDVATRKPLHTLIAQGPPVFGVAFHPDGKRLATCGDDFAVRIWDVDTEKELHSFELQAEVLCVAFSPDGTRLAASTVPGRSTKMNPTAAGQVVVWDVESRTEVCVLRGHGNGIHGIAFSPEGKRLATASFDQLVKVWDLDSRKPLAICRGHRDRAVAVTFSPDGKTLASAGWDGAAIIWDATSGQMKHVLVAGNYPVWGVAFSPDGKRLASSGDDAAVRIWDAERGRILFVLRGHVGGIANVVFRPDGAEIATASDDQTARLWPAENPGASESILDHADKVRSVAVSFDGRLMASASDDRTVRVRDLAARREVVCLRADDRLSCVAFQPNSTLLAYSGADGIVRVWNARTSLQERAWPAHNAAVWCIAFSPDGKRLATASSDNTVRIWDALTGRLERTLDGHSAQVWHVAFSPDGSRIATASADKTATVWDTGTGDVIHHLTGFTSAVLCVCFSPGGETLAASTDQTSRVMTGEPGQIKLFDARTGEERSTLQGHFRGVTCVIFTAGGKRIVSTSSDGTLKVWDRSSGQELLTLYGHTNAVRCVAATPDERLLISGGFDSNLLLWHRSR